MKNGKAAGLDNLSCEHLKYSHDPTIVSMLCKLFNIFLANGHVPDSLANVTHYLFQKVTRPIEHLPSMISAEYRSVQLYLNCLSTPFYIVLRTILLRLTTNLALKSTLAVVMLYRPTMFEMSLSII